MIRFLVELNVGGMHKLMEINNADEFAKAQNMLTDNRVILNYDSLEEGDKQLKSYNDSLNKPKAAGEVVTTSRKKPLEIKMWDLSKMSKKKWDVVFEYVKMKDWKNIFDVHNTLKLTDEIYCCDSYIVKVGQNILEAREQGVVVPVEVLKVIYEIDGL